MAIVNRGDNGQPTDARVLVVHPGLGRNGYRVEDDIEILCDAESCQPAWGFPVRIALTHDEALILCADLASRLAMRVNPPKMPRAEPITDGESILREPTTRR